MKDDDKRVVRAACPPVFWRSLSLALADKLPVAPFFHGLPLFLVKFW